MDSYLFLTSEFMPKADANGVCVYNVSRELIKKGHKVIVICEGGKGVHRIYDGIDIYEIEPTLFKKLKIKANASKSKKDIVIFNTFKILRRIYNIITVFRFPNVSPLRAKKEFKLIEEINRKEHIDCVVGGFRPSDSIEAMTWFKTKYPNIKTIAVYWDLIRSQNPFGKNLYRLMDILCYRNEKKVFSVNDKVLIPESGRNTYCDKRFDFAKEKIRYFDFPVFTDTLSISGIAPKNNECINLTCMGTIDGKNRSARYFLSLIKELGNVSNKKINVHIVGNFTDIATYEQFKDEDFVTFHGAVDYKEVLSYIQKADFLVNIANKETYDMIPSKIFQYFASCKPLVNFVAHKDDKSLYYFSKYPETLNILQYNENIFDDVEMLKEYIDKKEFSIPDFKTIEEIYRTNKPQYFADKFLK